MSDIRIETFVTEFAWILVAAVLVGMVAQRIGVSYAVALVIAGLIVEESHLVRVPDLSPGLVLFLFLPPLLFDASFRIDPREIRLVARPVALLAVPGVLLTALMVGVALWLALDVSFGVGLLFGSIVAATDPVAVLGIVKKLKVPHRLVTIPEAESLVNDGMAITLYTALIGYALTSAADVVDILRIFGQEVLGGILIGGALGFAFSRITGLIDDHSLEMMLSTVLAYGSYLMAHEFHASGPLACVAAGIIHGSYGRAVGMTPEVSGLLDDLWEYLGFLANAILFLLIGFSVNVEVLVDEAWPITVAIVVVVVARAVVVAATRLTDSPVAPVPRGERVFMVWAGLRGALTIALALALPAATPSRDLLIAMAFGVVLFTLLVQGLSLPTLVRRLGLEREEAQAGG